MAGLSDRERARLVERLRDLCLALPDAAEKSSWNTATFRAPNGKMFAMVDDDHHDSGHLGVWIKSEFEVQDMLVSLDSQRFFVPPYTGKSGWVGVRLNAPGVDWDEVAELLEDGYRLVAPKRAIARLDAGSA